ncbi:MAG: hypothetical protein MZU79_04420 [Anaerotruncus sp.]|nr:hypothetical protein [Anaerotruncus sp.]
MGGLPFLRPHLPPVHVHLGGGHPLSLLAKAENAADKRPIYVKLVKRALLLVLLGFVYNHLTDLQFATQRYASVLGQIGLAYLFAALIMLKVRASRPAGRRRGDPGRDRRRPAPRSRPGHRGRGPDARGDGQRLDRPPAPPRPALRQDLRSRGPPLHPIRPPPSRLWAAWPASCSSPGSFTAHRKAVFLAAAGLGLTTLGYVLGGWYPLIKKAWTATFDIYAAGWSLILLAFFYLVVDVVGWKKWSFAFRVIGLNSITIYLGSRMVDFEFTSRFWFGGLGRSGRRRGPPRPHRGDDRRRVDRPLFPL